LGFRKTAISEFSEALRKFGEFGYVQYLAPHRQPSYLVDLSSYSVRRVMLPVLACFLRRNTKTCCPAADFNFGSEDKMLLTVSIMILATQLVIAVADDVPKFDIARGCRIDSNAVYDPNLGMAGTIKRCVDDEQKAMDQLQTQWSGFINSDRTMCLASSTNDSSVPPSYVDLLTCLQDQQLARKLPKN
jgi:hypothetical protein